MKARYTLQPGYPSPGGTNLAILTAVRIVRAFANKTPTPEQLMRDFGMSRATAYRWVRALKAAA